METFSKINSPEELLKTYQLRKSWPLLLQLLPKSDPPKIWDGSYPPDAAVVLVPGTVLGAERENWLFKTRQITTNRGKTALRNG
jgi:hypothetical protein